MGLTYVDGKKAGHIVIYALSTCPWCQKAKKLLVQRTGAAGRTIRGSVRRGGGRRLAMEPAERR
jgi:glutaredoxin